MTNTKMLKHFSIPKQTDLSSVGTYLNKTKIIIFFSHLDKYCTICLTFIRDKTRHYLDEFNLNIVYLQFKHCFLQFST